MKSAMFKFLMFIIIIIIIIIKSQGLSWLSKSMDY
jgi:branched-subunit amino acid ABC-type transport system permease component